MHIANESKTSSNNLGEAAGLASLAALSLLVGGCRAPQYAAMPARLDPDTHETLQHMGVEVQISRVQGNFVRRFASWPTDGAVVNFSEPGTYTIAIETQKSDAAYIPYISQVYSNSVQVNQGQRFSLQIMGADWPHMNSGTLSVTRSFDGATTQASVKF